MPWETVIPERQLSNTVTLEKRGLGFSATFIRNEQLEEYDYIELRVDKTLRRIGFVFRNTPTIRTVRPHKRKHKGKRLRITRLFTEDEYSWIRDAILSPDGSLRPVGERRFIVEVDESIPDPALGVRYYISTGYKFAPTRDITTQGDYPRLPGVYRLYRDAEIVRIGESDDMERRLKDHCREYRGQVDAYDFVEIHDLAARKAEERRLLTEFEETYGRLPKHNPVRH